MRRLLVPLKPCESVKVGASQEGVLAMQTFDRSTLEGCMLSENCTELLPVYT